MHYFDFSYASKITFVAIGFGNRIWTPSQSKRMCETPT